MLLRYVRQHLKPHIYGYGYRGMVFQALNEAPQYLFGIPLFLMCLVFVPFRIKQYNDRDGDRRRFMFLYTICRPSDKARLKHFQYLDVTDKNHIIDMQTRVPTY